jgi:hypothetical protein
MVLTSPLLPWMRFSPASMGPLSEDPSPLRGMLVVGRCRVFGGFGRFVWLNGGVDLC